MKSKKEKEKLQKKRAGHKKAGNAYKRPKLISHGKLLFGVSCGA